MITSNVSVSAKKTPGWPGQGMELEYWENSGQVFNIQEK